MCHDLTFRISQLQYTRSTGTRSLRSNLSFFLVCHVYSLSSALELGRREVLGWAVRPHPLTCLLLEITRRRGTTIFCSLVMTNVLCQLSAINVKSEKDPVDGL